MFQPISVSTMQKWALFLPSKGSESIFTLFQQGLMLDSPPSTHASRKVFMRSQFSWATRGSHPWKAPSPYQVGASHTWRGVPAAVGRVRSLYSGIRQLFPWKLTLPNTVPLSSYFLPVCGRKLFPASRQARWDTHGGHGSWYTSDHPPGHWWVWLPGVLGCNVSSSYPLT